MVSRDRVQFTLSYASAQRCRDGQSLLDLLAEIMNVPYHELKAHLDYDEGITVICRPSQFARFIILRNETGFPNGIRELNAKLFIPAEEKKKEPIDVSKNPHKVLK